MRRKARIRPRSRLLSWTARLGAHFAELPVGSIQPNPRQPRQVFDEEALAELVHCIREIGLLQPVVVRPTGPGRYELVMGERRWRATQAAGLDTIPAIVRDTDDEAMLRDALLENLHRSQLNPLEEAAAYDQLLKDFGCTHDELAQRIGRSRPQISNTIRLLRLPPAVQRRVAAGVLSAGHARALLGLDDPDAQERLAQRIVAEGLSVRAVEEIVALGGDAAPAAAARQAPAADGSRPRRARRSALGPARDPGAGPARPQQGHGHDRLREPRGPRPHRHGHRPHRRPSRTDQDDPRRQVAAVPRLARPASGRPPRGPGRPQRPPAAAARSRSCPGPSWPRGTTACPRRRR